MAQILRLADETDAAQILGIYAPITRVTATSSETWSPSEEDMRGRIKSTLKQTPWILCDDGGTVLGYAYAGLYRTREAYQWSVENSLYIHADHQGLGIGRALYTALFACLRVQGYFNAYAGITLPNAPNVKLHKRMGFKPVGVYEAVGYKLGQWHEVVWWHLALQERHPSPSPPRPLGKVLLNPEWLEALMQGQDLLNK